MNIRPAKLSDTDQICQLWLAANTRGQASAQMLDGMDEARMLIEHYLGQDRFNCHVAVKDNRIVGFIVSSVQLTNDASDISHHPVIIEAVVARDYQQSGVHVELFNTIVKGIRPESPRH